MILFCFVLLLGAGLKGYGQDRKIVIDTIFYASTDFRYFSFLQCECREKKCKKNLIIFYFYDKDKNCLISKKKIKGCEFVVTESMFKKYCRQNVVSYYVLLEGIGRWTSGELSSQDIVKRINIYPTKDDIMGNDECFQWFINRINELRNSKEKIKYGKNK